MEKIKESSGPVPIHGIWSNRHADQWENGYIVGNGTIGGVLFGGPSSGTLIGNHHRLFLKENDMEHLPDIASHLPELRKIISSDGYQAGIDFFEEKAIEKDYAGLTMSDRYHPAFQLNLALDNTTVKKNSYVRQLDYQKGLVTEIHQDSSERWYEKQLFSSEKENILAFSIESDQPFDLTLSLENFQNERLNQTVKYSPTTAIQKNSYQDDSFYTTVLEWSSSMASSNDKGLHFKQIKKVEFIIRIFWNEEEKFLATKNFKSILGEHITDHKKKYDQSSLQLTTDEERSRSLESIVEEMKRTNQVPLVLYEKLYDASRYVIHSSIGEAMPNLQGIWGGDFSPAWSGDYTMDTNIQLAISSLNSLGLSEKFNGFFSRMKEYEKDFEENAMKYFGCRGYLVPAHASTTAKHVHWNREWPLVFWTSGAGWLAHFYQEYFDYTQDKDFLKKVALPFFKKTLLFYEDFIQYKKDGTGLIQPSYSAENGMGDNATMDIAVIKEVFDNLSKACDTLGEKVPENYKKLVVSLPQYAVNDEGILKEWIDPNKEENYNHRHFSQFYPLFQSKEITKKTPKLWKATQKAFDKKLSTWLLNKEGETSSSHGRMHAAMCAISLEREEDVESALDELILNHAWYDSLVTAHYNEQEVFNIDANGAIPKIYHDALIYAESETTFTLFKALPSWLSKGKAKGIFLPGQVRVEELEWDLQNGKLSLKLEAQTDCKIVLCLKDNYSFAERKGLKTKEIELQLKKGLQYQFESIISRKEINV